MFEYACLSQKVVSNSKSAWQRKKVDRESRAQGLLRAALIRGPKRDYLGSFGTREHNDGISRRDGIKLK